MCTWIPCNGLTKILVRIRIYDNRFKNFVKSKKYGEKYYAVCIFFVVALLQKRVDEIARLNDLRRRDHERSFRLVCNLSLGGKQ